MISRQDAKKAKKQSFASYFFFASLRDKSCMGKGE